MWITKDYANRRKIKKYNHKKPRSRVITPSFPVWGWVLIGCFIGSGFCTILAWKLLPLFISKEPNVLAVSEDAAPLKSIPIAKENNPKQSTDRFDFYTLLPDLTIDVEDVVTNPTETTKEQLANKNPIDAGSFIVQTGSFKKKEQAEQFKASLALLGFEPHIQTVTIHSGETWYRVYVGPFTNKIDATIVQNELEKEQSVNTLILRIKV